MSIEDTVRGEDNNYVETPPHPYSHTRVVRALPTLPTKPLRQIPHFRRGQRVGRPLAFLSLGRVLRSRLGLDVCGQKENGEGVDFGQEVEEEEVHRTSVYTRHEPYEAYRCEPITCMFPFVVSLLRRATTQPTQSPEQSRRTERDTR